MDKISRRSFAKIVGVGAVGLVAGRSAFAQEGQTPRPITAGFDERTKALYDRAVSSNNASARSRLRFELPENSEPCTVFRAEEHK